jgi:hypothetical protein
MKWNCRGSLYSPSCHCAFTTVQLSLTLLLSDCCTQENSRTLKNKGNLRSTLFVYYTLRIIWCYVKFNALISKHGIGHNTGQGRVPLRRVTLSCLSHLLFWSRYSKYPASCEYEKWEEMAVCWHRDCVTFSGSSIRNGCCVSLSGSQTKLAIYEA